MISVRTLTRTALLAAVIIAAQQLRVQQLTGSIVNLVLAISPVMLGLPGSAILSFISPALAVVQGIMPLPVMYPFIAVGNLVYCLIFHSFRDRWYLALLLGTLLKPGIIACGFFFAARLPLTTAAAMGGAQALTALIGGIGFAVTVNFILRRFDYGRLEQ